MDFIYRNYSRNKQGEYEKNLIKLLSTAPKVFHAYLRERKKGCPSVGPIISTSRRLVSDLHSMSEIFVEAFASVFIQ